MGHFRHSDNRLPFDHGAYCKLVGLWRVYFYGK